MRFGWLKARQTKYTAYLITYLVVVLAILTAVNWLANRHNKSYDSTANKRFSLSDQTVKVVKGLKQDAKIVYFDKTSEFTRARDSVGPVLRWIISSCPARFRSSQKFAVRRSCHTMALQTGSPVPRSHRTVVSRWLVMPMAARSPALIPARASAVRATSS